MKQPTGLLFFIFCFSWTLLTYAGNPHQEHADELFLSGNIEKAFRIYGDAIKADTPEEMNYQLYLSAGDCAYMMNYKQIALNYYGISAQKGASINTLMKHVSIIYCQNETSCTCEALKYIITKYPDTKDSLSTAIADILFGKSRYEESTPIYRKILDKEPKNYKIKKRLAESLLYMDNSDSAKILYQEIDQDSIVDYDTYVFLGNYYYLIAQRQSKTILKEMEYTKKYQTNDSPSEEIGRYYDKAAYYLEKAYLIYNSKEIKETLIDIYIHTKEKDKINKYK
ncbi:MAG: hypothetical protein H6544_03330 [Prevotellaceae bacterium]|nr:hypothetical protein [Prevotellaceae bacterium]